MDTERGTRLLSLYDQLLNQGFLQKQQSAQRFGVTMRTLQRDIDALRSYLAEQSPPRELSYDSRSNRYYLVHQGGSRLSNGEMLAVCKILLESRSLPRKEMDSILDKLLACTTAEEERNQLKALIANERLYYLEPHHGKPLTEKLWTLAGAIRAHQVLEISYHTQTGESKHRRIKPVGLMFSEFYFYLTAFLEDIDRAKEFENPEDPYPTIYRVDRIAEIQVQEERFYVPYGQRFSEGEFRKRVQFMYGGRLRIIRFTYSGPSVEAILDRLPTAKICQERDGVYEIEAEVFGKGIEMWLRSQGAQIVLLN